MGYEKERFVRTPLDRFQFLLDLLSDTFPRLTEWSRALGVIRVHRITRSASGSPLATPCALDELRLNGVVLLSNVNGRSLIDPVYRPFFEEANRRSLCIFLHPMLPASPEPYRNYVLGPIVGFPADVREVMLGEQGALAGSKAGNILVDMTTSLAELRGAFFGSLALRLLRGTNEVEVRVKLPEEQREDIHHLEDLVIRTPGGADRPWRPTAAGEGNAPRPR